MKIQFFPAIRHNRRSYYDRRTVKRDQLAYLATWADAAISEGRCLGLPDGRSLKRPTCLCAPDFRIGVGTLLELPGCSARLRSCLLRSYSGSRAAPSRQIQRRAWAP